MYYWCYYYQLDVVELTEDQVVLLADRYPETIYFEASLVVGD